MLDKHTGDYKEHAWMDYTFEELGQWVHLLAVRAMHRTNPVKRDKDLYDATNYLEMMERKLELLKADLQGK